MLVIFFFILFIGPSIGAIPLKDLFPFGIGVGDTILQQYDVAKGPLLLPYSFPYFDIIYDEISIIKTGLFSFPSLSSAYDFNFPESFDALNESSVIAGFWHLNTWNMISTVKNSVYYQIYNHTSESNGTIEVFDKTNNYVRKFFPEQRAFNAKMVIVGTWYYITAGNNGTGEFNNTFQIVLSTDEDRSFVFFLYHDLQWADPYNYTNQNYNAQAGFHNSERNKSQTLPYSGTKDIVKLVNESNVNLPGLFAFRVDADRINDGGCNENVSTISFRPRVSSQLGSTALNIYGPCFTSQTKIKCQFGPSRTTVNGTVIDKFRAICLTPFLSNHRSVSVNVSIDNGQTYISAGTFIYAPLKFGSDEVMIDTEDGDNLLNVGQYIKLEWYFSDITKNTFPNDAKIDIELWKVSLKNSSELQKDNQLIILKRNLALTNSVRIQLPSNISSIQTCFIRIVVRSSSQAYTGLNTGLLIVRSPRLFAPALCQRWANQQPEPSTWNGDGLLQCPMTRQQVIAAGRCCYEPDRQCSLNNHTSNNCWLHRARPGHDEPSAVECYLSITTNRYDARAECCYDNETMLITRGTGAGTDDRYGSSTSPVQHFFHDTLPYLQCCVMSTDSDSCNKYMYYRPPRRGSNTMGETGRMWGDPHFGTLDGFSYTFNGYGEYTYLAISKNMSPPAAFDPNPQSYIFMSQIRTIPILKNNATVTKGFAAKSNDAGSKSISVTISHRQQLILHRGNQIIEFEDNIEVMHFPELTISRLDGNSNSNFSVAWTIGVTIEINVIKMTSPSKQLVLNIGASVAEIFRQRTYGLLGTYDGIANNDLRSRTGSSIDSNATLEQIHKNFGTTWAIDPSTSLFHYESNQSAQFYETQNRNFTPSFYDPTEKNNLAFRSSCGINATSSHKSWNMAQRTCYYDLSITNDIGFANASFDAGNQLLSIQTKEKNPPLFNSPLPVQMNLNENSSVNLIINASSEYPLHTVELSASHLPMNATFNNNTCLFKWKVIKGEHYASFRAHDKTTNLTSKHDIAFFVNTFVESTTTQSSTSTLSTDKSTTTRSNGSYSYCFNGINYFLLILAFIILFSQ